MAHPSCLWVQDGPQSSHVIPFMQEMAYRSTSIPLLERSGIIPAWHTNPKRNRMSQPRKQRSPPRTRIGDTPDTALDSAHPDCRPVCSARGLCHDECQNIRLSRQIAFKVTCRTAHLRQQFLFNFMVSRKVEFDTKFISKWRNLWISRQNGRYMRVQSLTVVRFSSRIWTQEFVEVSTIRHKMNGGEHFMLRRNRICGTIQRELFFQTESG